jgi:hypothetical protein
MITQKIQIRTYPTRQMAGTAINGPDNLMVEWVVRLKNRHKSPFSNILLHMKTTNTAQAKPLKA